MSKSSDDAFNAVLLDARRQLRELQNSLNNPDIQVERVLSQLSETTNRLHNEAESLSANFASESTVIPLTTPRKKPALIQKPQNNAPREYVPYKVNKATRLRRQVAPKARRQKNLPKLFPEDKNLSAAELIAMGKIKNYDDIGDLLPIVDGKSESMNAPIFPTIHIDIKGAAQAFKEMRIRQKEKAERINNAIKKLCGVSINSDQSKLDDLREIEEEEEKEPENQQPRIYEELQDEYAFQTLLVVRGKIARETPDFESFKRTNEIHWKKIEKVLASIEAFCEKYEIQFAEINGRKLGEAALLSIITEADVHDCLLGVDEFIKKKQDSAALTIQKFWRMILENQNREENKLYFRAAYTIQSFWRRMVDKKKLMGNVKLNLSTVEDRALDLSKSLYCQFRNIERNTYVIVHVIATQQDLSRCFDLMYKNAELILMLPKLPPPHIWEEFVELLAQCGVPDANSRIHFITLKEGDGVSNRLLCDMKSVHLARKFICGRNAFLVPHSDWSSERIFSVDIGLPIFGVTDTTGLQSRSGIRSIFEEAGIVPTISTHESQEFDFLVQEAFDLINENSDLARWIIRLGYNHHDSGIAWFELSDEFLDDEYSLNDIIRNSLNSIGSAQSFLSQIKNLGATIEGIPSNVHSFPTVSMFLTGDEIRVIGTFDRLYYSPFRFTCNLIPSISVDHEELIAMAKQVGSVLLKRKILGYIMVDFLTFKEENEIRIIGFDIRLNAYPSILSTAYMTLCCGYKANKNKMILLNTIKTDNQNSKRFAVVQNCLTHPAFGVVNTKELKRVCYGQGLMFDLLNRTGFRMIFYDSPASGKGFALSAGLTPNIALDKMEKSYNYLLKYLVQRGGSDTSSSIAHAVLSIRHFKDCMRS